MTREGLPPRRRLARASDLQAVQRTGRRHRTPRLDIHWRPNTLGHPRFGLVVPRFGRTAVARNRLRRQLREIVRRRVLPTLESLDLVVRSRAAAYGADHQVLATDLGSWAQAHFG